MKLSKYQANGFRLLSSVPPGGIREYPVLTATAIVKGDYVVPSSGYAATATAFAVLAFGIAAEDADNTSGASGAINVKCIPLLSSLQFSVPVAANAVIARSNVGTLVDLENNDDLDLSDTTIAACALGFFIDDFDASAAAVAANTYGYAIGHFVVQHQ